MFVDLTVGIKHFGNERSRIEVVDAVTHILNSHLQNGRPIAIA